ncbi:hypothetical protein F400_gp123 [Bacillus phage BCD7]|uniref:Uncharacterized protein n=1 Tax=Bacillus phage BCD7 TaxID=1136534 RepID=J9PVD2_9CAUD|nr:hypothetical protein F400_gp123 [Bacillus phage BCD7]AEZ50570.1 hypothetical protein BCD7_0123 [Bacillus phage BCD7]
MTEQELYNKLLKISDIGDFHLEFWGHSEDYWARYYVNKRLIVIYDRDENGDQYDESVLIREGLHELTHHIQHCYIPFWKRLAEDGKEHDSMFWELFRAMQRIAAENPSIKFTHDEICCAKEK